MFINFSNRQKSLVILLPVCLVIASAAAVIFFYRHLKDLANESCVLSVEDVISRAMQEQELSDRIPLTDSWRQLNWDERQLLLGTVDKNKSYDCDEGSPVKFGKTKAGEDMMLFGRRRGDYLEVRFEGSPLMNVKGSNDR